MTTSPQLIELSKPVTRTVYFAEFQFRSGTMYVSSMNEPYTWNSISWVGLGAIGAIDAVQESDSIDAKALTFTLNIAQSSILALAAGDVAEYRGRAAKLYFCPMDESFQLVDTPELCWTGIMDTLAIGMDNEQGGISLRCESRAYALKRRPSLRLNAAQQKNKHPGDTGLDYLTDLISKPQLWLSKKFQSQP